MKQAQSRTRRLKFWSAGLLGRGVLGGLFTTTRVRRIDDEHYLRFRREGRPYILVFWHGQLLSLTHYHRHEGICVLQSDHADGEYMSRVIRRMGFRSVRGSSTRGGARGLRALVRAAREGHALGLTPDGPRGPARQVKPGVFMAAQLTGAPIIPMACGASSAWHLATWDKFLVPKPFSCIQIAYSEPFWVPRALTKHDRAALATELQETLNSLTERANEWP